MADKMHPDTSRTIWIGWGIALISLGIAYFLRGPFWAYLFIFVGIAIAMRGHWPQLFQHSLSWLVTLVAVILFSISASWLHSQYHQEKPKESTPKKTEFKLSLLGGNIFVPESASQLTGLALDVEIRNAGKASIATDWKLLITVPGERPMPAQLTKPPPQLRLHGEPTVTLYASDFSLEKEAKSKPIEYGASPLEGKLLFYAELPKDKLENKDTLFELRVSDLAGNTFSTTQRYGDWLKARPPERKEKATVKGEKPKWLPQKEAAHVKPSRPEPSSSFVLADCTFDGSFEVRGNFEAFRKAFPESGTATVIIDIYPKDMPEEDINIVLSGEWHGTSGMMHAYPNDSIVFTASEKTFLFLHKKPIINQATNAMTQLFSNKEYVIELKGVPGFGVDLVPKALSIRSRQGLLFTISNFVLSKEHHGKYYATFRVS